MIGCTKLRTYVFEGEVPGVVPCQANMLPVHRREMAQLLCGHLHSFASQLLNGSCQFQGIPQDDGCHDQIEPLGTLLPLGMRTVLHSSLPIEKDGSCQRIACLSLIQADLYPPTQFKCKFWNSTSGICTILATRNFWCYDEIITYLDRNTI